MKGYDENVFLFKHMIKVDLKPSSAEDEAIGSGTTSIKYQLAVAVAKELGLLDEQYNMLKQSTEEFEYYTYGCNQGATSGVLEDHVRFKIVPQIIKKLSTEQYLLVVENLQWPIETGSFTLDVGLPPPRWANSQWFISTTSHEAYNESKSENDRIFNVRYEEDVVILVLFALRLSAEHMVKVICQGNEDQWHHIVIDCFHYAMAVFSRHSNGVLVTPDELIYQWAAQGILARTSNEETGTCSSKCSYVHRVGRVILEAFQKYSLLQLPFLPANDSDEATATAAQFLAYHDLIAEGTTVQELFENKKNWISFAGDCGWHVSRQWLTSEQETNNGPTALILRGCSQHSLVLSKIDNLLEKLCFLRALDLSYTPLESLPSSIGYLLNLRLLSLRGCRHLRTLFSSTKTRTTDSTMNISSYSPVSTLCHLEILDMNGVPLSHLTQDVANQKGNLLHLDMSHSEITTFPSNFFQDMSNLEELILVNCSRLTDLPHSVAELSSLTNLEVTGTQIRYLPQNIFEEMQKLQSLKLINNKKLISFAESISRAHGLIDLHIEGYESIMVEEIRLEKHPTLVSFMLIHAPYIRRLSLCGCRNLESVELKNLGLLEELDLSATAIKELSADIPNLLRLSQLVMVGVPSLRRFPWHKLKRLPDVFCLDQCADRKNNQFDQVTQVWVNDFRFFYSFDQTVVDFIRNRMFFQHFYVQIAPCITNCRKPQDVELMLHNKLQEMVQKKSTYLDVYSSCNAEVNSVTSPLTAPLRQTDRHLEIFGMQQTPDGLDYLLNVTRSILVTCDNSILHLYSMHYNPGDNSDLEECELHECHKMEIVFSVYAEDIKNLRNVHACNLKRLVMFCTRLSTSAFSSLERMHLEYCPRLEHMVPLGTKLPCLKTIDIMFCYNLKTIFNSEDSKDIISYQLPCLQRIRLQELPLLQHFDNNNTTIVAPMWKELHIRGCWSLRRLPRLQDQLKLVKVSGERSWWNKLQWDSPSHCESYEPKLPPAFASFDKRVEVTSYLR
uniref:Uncharacterized protein n=1 Tax=Avena sativa TaxID=4498 RepID=A0ACD5W840_AVESA